MCEHKHRKKTREMDKVGIPTPFSDKVGGGKMQTSSPPVITPNRSQSNPDDMITLPRPIQSVGMDLHDVSGTSTGQTLPRERRAPPGTHFCPTIWWVYPYSATIFILHPLLSTFSSTFVRNIPTCDHFFSERAARGGGGGGGALPDFFFFFFSLFSRPRAGLATV